MDFDNAPHNLLHEAVEEACNANPRLVLMPYEQMKAAALILSRKVIALRKQGDAAPRDVSAREGE